MDYIEYIYRVKGDIPKELLGYDPEKKLIECVYNHDEHLQKMYSLDEMKNFSSTVYDTDNFDEIQF